MKFILVNSFHALDMPQNGHGIPATLSMMHELSYLNRSGNSSATRSLGVKKIETKVTAMNPKRMNRSLSDSVLVIFSTKFIAASRNFAFC